MRNFFNKFIFSITLVTILGIIYPYDASSKLETNVPSDISGEELKAVVIEDFEAAQANENGWNIESIPKKFEKAETEKKLKMKDPVPILDIKVVDGQPNDLGVEEWSLTGLGKKKEKCLGVKFQFRYPGYNSIHIIAPPELMWANKKPALTYNPSTGKDEQEKGLQLPGRAKAISLWVHGRGHPYELELCLKDYRGQIHILKFGSVNFVGWRPLKVYIPIDIPQTFQSFPQTRVTKITKFILRADVRVSKEELMEPTYFFFDQIKVLTDTYEVNFDGKELDEAFDGSSAQKSEGTTN